MGEVVISLDAELAWGYHDLPDPPARMDDAREGWSTALDLFERFEVPATWAVVGHLFLEACDGTHADHPLAPEWFEADPGTTLAEDDLWYGRDLVESVAASDVGHELASHSFSHVEMHDQSTERAVAEAEVRASVEAADRLGVPLESFVFPRNYVGHRDVLAEQGFTCYRGTEPTPGYDDARFRRVWKLADWYLGGESPPLVTPTVDEHGLVDVPASLYMFSFEGLARRLLGPVWDDPVVTVARRGIDRAAEGDGVFHLWLHPHDLLQPDGTERMAAILAYLAERRAEEVVAVKTMQEVATEVLEGTTRSTAEPVP